ncbi:hypothetical protein HY626_02010 [Candidatus Uhrbacteria bacterium]|nr:hypothetical protein [Candidatus Uhrbacteria bacterium]
MRYKKPPDITHSTENLPMHACPERNCKYRTPHSKNMDLHKENTGHGKGGGREFRGHLSTGGGQKKKADDSKGGKKGARR